MDSSKINVEVELAFYRYGNKRVRACLVWKNKPYPENFIGCGVTSVSKTLNISGSEAVQLFVDKLNELLPSIKNEELRSDILKKIEYFKNSAIYMYDYKNRERVKHAI